MMSVSDSMDDHQEPIRLTLSPISDQVPWDCSFIRGQLSLRAKSLSRSFRSCGCLQPAYNNGPPNVGQYGIEKSRLKTIAVPDRWQMTVVMIQSDRRSFDNKYEYSGVLCGTARNCSGSLCEARVISVFLTTSDRAQYHRATRPHVDNVRGSFSDWVAAISARLRVIYLSNQNAMAATRTYYSAQMPLSSTYSIEC